MWQLKRKLMYAMAVIVTVVAVFTYALRTTIFPEPTCVDGRKNGFELGVDCGGTCDLRCTQEVTPLTVVWSKAIKSGQNLYDLVALVGNNNIDNASIEVGFSFFLYDDQGQLMKTFYGSTTAPLDGKFPLIIQNLPLEKEPKNVVVTLSDGPHYKVKESPTSPTIKILDRRYEAGSIPRVYAKIVNTKQNDIANLQVRVVLYDENNNAFAVGQTNVPALSKEEVKEIVFTWNEPLPTTPVKIELYPIFNPFEARGY